MFLHSAGVSLKGLMRSPMSTDQGTAGAPGRWSGTQLHVDDWPVPQRKDLIKRRAKPALFYGAIYPFISTRDISMTRNLRPTNCGSHAVCQIEKDDPKVNITHWSCLPNPASCSPVES